MQHNEVPIPAMRVLDVLPMPVLLLDEDDAVDYANAAAAELFGASALYLPFADQRHAGEVSWRMLYLQAQAVITVIRSRRPPTGRDCRSEPVI